MIADDYTARCNWVMRDVILHEIEVRNLTLEKLAGMSDIPFNRMLRAIADCRSFTLPQVIRMGTALGIGGIGLVEAWGEAMADTKEIEVAASTK